MARTTAAAFQRSRWGVIVIAIAAGIVAAVQVGKVPPLITLLQAELGITLVAAGWLEPGDAVSSAAMTFGGGSEDLATSGFFVESESNLIGDDGDETGGSTADALGLVGDENGKQDFSDFSLEGDAEI